MNLAQYQRRLYQLIREHDTLRADDSAWLKTQVDRGRVALTREISDWWVAYNVEIGCVLSARLLRRLDLWQAALDGVVVSGPAIAYLPDLTDFFLARLSEHGHSVVAALARFERALIGLKNGAATRQEIPWPVHPLHLLNALLEDEPLPEPDGNAYETVVSPEFPEGYKAYAL